MANIRGAVPEYRLDAAPTEASAISLRRFYKDFAPTELIPPWI
jgi:hypothetical protein